MYIVQNIEIRKRRGIDTDIVETSEARRLKCYQHLERMDDNRWPKRICAWTPLNRMERGRPRRTGRNDVNQVLWDKSAGVGTYLTQNDRG
jgi:hypothetical protein